MTRSFKMVVLRALLGRDALPGGLTLDELTAEFARVARRAAALRADVGEDLDDQVRLRKYLEKNPVAAWVGGKATHPGPRKARDKRQGRQGSRDGESRKRCVSTPEL
jgi:hypothetical protein